MAATARAAEDAGVDAPRTSENRVMSKAGQWDHMAAEVPDDVVRLFAAVGTWRDLAGEVARRFGGAVDTVGRSGGYGVRQAAPPDLVQDIRRISSACAGCRSAW